MGWCSVFDPMAELILASDQTDDQKVAIPAVLVEALEHEDWDCWSDSDDYDDPIVKRYHVHPDWAEDDDDDEIDFDGVALPDDPGVAGDE